MKGLEWNVYFTPILVKEEETQCTGKRYIKAILPFLLFYYIHCYLWFLLS